MGPLKENLRHDSGKSPSGGMPEKLVTPTTQLLARPSVSSKKTGNPQVRTQVERTEDG